MAQTVQEAFGVLGLLSVFLLIQRCHGFQFKVGGSGTWTVPADNAVSYNQWAEKSRDNVASTFYVNDFFFTLIPRRCYEEDTERGLFVYAGDKDCVLHVTKDDYTNCNTEAPLEKFTDGHTVFKFNQSGPHYFISGVADNCHKNEKLVVVVMADRSKNYSNGTVPSSPPAPTPEVPPPSPAPSGEESPSPPSGVEINPSPAPSQESSPPKNGASSFPLSVFGTIAAFLGSSLVLAV
ncbi:Early nodulin-like protein 1 [Sesamum angolense]|uniref:Early nodulin-like protein 1 n=1 Tax=Sesamum angolense TaxID=2727404 RepID=A0AAE1W559_9LAMI|nr:Early nodulin-like protein 1 [Sesamum angolense]